MACTTTTDSQPSFPSVFSGAERYSWWSLLSGSEVAFLLVVMALAYTLRASRHLDLSRSGVLKLIWIELLRTTTPQSLFGALLFNPGLTGPWRAGILPVVASLATQNRLFCMFSCFSHTSVHHHAHHPSSHGGVVSMRVI